MCISNFFSSIQPYQTLIASCVAGFIAYSYNRSKNKLDHESFRREIFLRYNEKYSFINSGLEKLLTMEYDTNRDSQFRPSEVKPLGMLWDEWFEDSSRPEILDAVYDYLNLCAEEYYWYKKGFVDDDVWKCWLTGMKKWHEYSFFVKKIISDEKTNNASYYNSDFLELFTGGK